MERAKAIVVMMVVMVFVLLVVARADWIPGDPYKMHWPQLPNPEGWDVMASEPFILADDFECAETGLIKDIHFWGSWFDDIGELGMELGFWISIHPDIPADQNPHGPYSMPGPPYFMEFFTIDMFAIAGPFFGDQGWYEPPAGWSPSNHTMYWQYNLYLPEDLWTPQEEGNIYWLNISAQTIVPQLFLWGWKTTSFDLQFLDNAVYTDFQNYPDLWFPLTEPSGEPLDLAFVITGGPEPTVFPEIETECPLIATRCPVDPTNCPVIETQCVEQPVETVCPELTTWCPDDDPTICFITECPEEPTWCPIIPTSCPNIPTIQPEIITECPLVDTICTQADTVCGTEFTFCPELITECFWSPTYCSFEYTFCEINWFTLCPEIPTVCPDSTPTVCKVTLCPEDQTLCSPVDTACPLEPTFCDPAGPTFCNQITFCQIPITQCPIPCEPTIFPNEPTECPMRWTFCPEQITQCPVIKTACPFDDPTICSIDLLPTECPIGDFTWCPEIPTQCPQLDTWCPDNLPTICEVTACPDDLTWCPIDPTVCPSVDIPTICPVVDTACPVIDTTCPAVITACLVDPTICEITECPVDPTTCPHIPTECDLGEFTMCPGDNDGDGVSNCNDNCYKHPNGPLGGTCTSGNYGASCTVPGVNITECGTGGYCSMMQEDTYPPGGNGAGCADACECEGNFNADEDDDVDGSDAALFKADFGRGGYNRPCSTSDPCDGDFDCDTDVDGSDAALFKSDFGRGGYNNPCPICLTDPWCVYP